MGKTILLVEDEDRMRKLISDYLKIEDFNVIEATNGNEALLQFSSKKIDLIILDVMMPGLDGFEVCKAIRLNSDVPIIFLTAKGEEEDKLTGFELGADEYVTWSHHKNSVQLVKGLKKEGWKIFALEEHERAQPVSWTVCSLTSVITPYISVTTMASALVSNSALL